MTIFGKRNSSYKQFKNQSAGLLKVSNTAVKQTNTAQPTSQMKSVEVVDASPGCSIFTRRKTATQRQQEFIRAINILYGAERRARTNPIDKT